MKIWNNHLFLLFLLCASYPTGAADLLISEIMYNPASTEDKAWEWVEIFNSGSTTVDLSGYVLDDNDYSPLTAANILSGSIAPGQTAILFNADLNNATALEAAWGSGINWIAVTNWPSLSNSGDQLGLWDSLTLYAEQNFANAIDEVDYDDSHPWPSDNEEASIYLIDLALDNQDGSNWALSKIGVATPLFTGYDSAPAGDNEAINVGSPGDFIVNCGNPATLISTIQGDGTISPEEGNIHTLEGVVVGDLQEAHELKGFFVQEESDDSDGDSNTSEGIFVYDNDFGVEVNLGQVVRVTGTVAEYFGLTRLTNLTRVESCPGTPTVTPASITLPVTSEMDLERYEGMLINLPQTLTVSENYNLGHQGEIVVSKGRLISPTQVAIPGAAAIAVQAQNDLNRLIIDDNNSQPNPATIIYPTPKLTAFNTLRNGDTVTGIKGVLNYRYGEYRVHPLISPNFVAANPRTPAPTLVGGSLKVASFNVLNYFNGDGLGGGFPTPRGADTASEFIRQRDKTIQAIIAIDADIMGLVEIENDGYGEQSAIQDLVNGLNAITGTDTYDFIDPNVTKIGTDRIAVGFIYKTRTIKPIGTAATLNAAVDPSFLDRRNRPSLAQTFEEIATGEQITIAINHFKSKGSDCNNIGDPDIGDGQGHCNRTRTDAAIALANWLATDPTGSGDLDFLIIGDLNSYAKEDPITAIKNAGYLDLIGKFQGNETYSYVFKGQAGYLDHALANMSLFLQVTGTTLWPINADEPRVLDYNEEYKSTEQLSSLYNADPYRSSDHDPVIIGLQLGQMPLKVDITNFTATAAGNQIRLEWQIAADPYSDNLGFKLRRHVATERKCPTQPAEFTDSVKESNHSSEPLFIWRHDNQDTYSHTEIFNEEALGMTYCYLLEMIDCNGESTYWLESIPSTKVHYH